MTPQERITMQFIQAFNLLKKRSAFALLTLLTLLTFANTGSANSVTISCTDLNSNDESCSLSSTEGFTSESMIDLVGNLMNALDSNNTSVSQCTRNDNIVSCNLGEAGLQLSCTIEEDGNINSASCGLSDLPAGIFSLNCSSNGDSGECTLENDPEAISSYLKSAADSSISSNGLSILNNIVSGCGFQSNTTSLQNDCNNLLEVLSNGTPGQIQNLAEAITPGNADTAADTNMLKTQQLTGSVRQRLFRARSGATGIDVAAIRYFDGMQWVQAGDLLASNSGSTITDSSPDTGSGSILTKQQNKIIAQNIEKIMLLETKKEETIKQLKKEKKSDLEKNTSTIEEKGTKEYQIMAFIIVIQVVLTAIIMFISVRIYFETEPQKAIETKIKTIKEEVEKSTEEIIINTLKNKQAHWVSSMIEQKTKSNTEKTKIKENTKTNKIQGFIATKKSAVSNSEKSAVSNSEKSAVSNGEKSAVSNSEKSAINNSEKSAVNNSEKSVCPYCKKLFIKTVHNKKFCSPECSTNYHKEKHGGTEFNPHLYHKKYIKNKKI